MNKKPLLLSAAVLALCAAGIFQSRDALLGRVSAVHSAAVQGAGTHAFAAGMNNADVQKGDSPLSLGNKQAQSSAASSTDLAQAPRTPQQAPRNATTTPQTGAGDAVPVVDESALRYFAARGDTARLQAEIARLRALYPNWTPPADPTAAAPTGDPQLEGIWQLYATGRYSEARKAIADRQAAEAGWQPPDNLTEMLDIA